MATQYYVATHTDLDGTACEIVSRLLYEDPIVVRAEADKTRADEVVRKLIEQRRNGSGGFIVIADICPSEEVLQELDEEGGVFLFDHHVTAVGRCYKYSWAVIDQNRCGAKIMFEEESKRLERKTDPDVLAFINAVDAYDRWQLGSPDRLLGENLNYLHRFIWWDRMIRRGPRVELDDRERWVVECFKEKIARDAERVIQIAQEGVDEEGHKFVAAVADVYTSDVAEAIAQGYPEAEYIAVVNPMEKSVSLRTRNGQKLDVSKIAKAHGGRGHPEAADFPLTINVLKLLGTKSV